MSEVNNFIAWRPNGQEAFFGATPQEARDRACHPKRGWVSLAAAGWRVDGFPHTVLPSQPQASDDDLMQRVDAVKSIPPDYDMTPVMVMALLHGQNDDTYRSISPDRALAVFMGRQDPKPRFGMGDKQDGWDVR